MQSEQMKAPFDRLMIDPANVRRKYDEDSITSMKASILAHGIIQPLAVRPPQESDIDLGGQLYRVFAGGRRFRAVSALIAENALPADYAIPIIIRDSATDRDAEEMSLAENLIRHAMAPADEFRAFKDLADKGLSVAEIALRFGQSDRFVRGRLALGNVHPEILAAYETGELNLEAISAYTLQPDQEAQVAYFRDADDWTASNPHYIRKAMRGGEGIRADSKLAGFIGEERYLAAGGAVSEDLFGSETFWTSGDIVEQLKAQALDEFRKQAADEGWSFVSTVQEFGIYGLYEVSTLAPEAPAELSDEETQRIDELAQILETESWDDDDHGYQLNDEYETLTSRNGGFTDEQKAKSGIVIDTERMEWRVGAIRPEDVRKQARAGSSTSDGAAPAKTKDPLALTQPLKDQIGEAATASLAAAVEADPHKALALVAAMLAAADNTTMGIGRPSRIKVERVDYGGSSSQATVKKSFTDFVKEPPEDLLKTVANLAALTVDLSERWFQKDYTGDSIREKTRSDFMAAFSADPLAAFDHEAWFGACTKPMIEAAAKEMGLTLGAGKKGDMARQTASMAKERGWLPKNLRLKGYALKKPSAGGDEKPKKARAKKAA